MLGIKGVTPDAIQPKNNLSNVTWCQKVELGANQTQEHPWQVTPSANEIVSKVTQPKSKTL